MALEQHNPRKLPAGVLLVVLCLLSIILMTVWTKESSTGPLHMAKAGIEVVITPFKTAGSVITAPVRGVGDILTGVTTDASTVEVLQMQNELLQSQAIRMEEYRLENDRLSKLLELKEAYNLESVGARVISSSTDSWNQVITLNKGSVAGLSVGMPVMSANGLIGQVETVSLYSSTVRLITDEKSGVSVFLQSTRTEGILSGSIDGILVLDFIPLNVTVSVGEPVITSGAGGIFPKGIPIGEVASVDFASSDVYQTIVVKPITRVSTYVEVLVVIGSEAEILPSDSGQEANEEVSATDGTQGN
jgi:rod shape-determining protein MreC